MTAGRHCVTDSTAQSPQKTSIDGRGLAFETVPRPHETTNFSHPRNKLVWNGLRRFSKFSSNLFQAIPSSPPIPKTGLSMDKSGVAKDGGRNERQSYEKSMRSGS
jgi:hypothetical protein